MSDHPRRIGNYELLNVLGEGGMGTVYLGEHPDIGLKVAIKVLHRTEDEDSGGYRRFRDEARLLVKLKHPNIVQTSDFGRTPQGQLYYVMEHLHGRHLRDVISEKVRFSPGEALKYLDQLCSALAAAHRLGVVHRDLKPDNIFITEVEGEPRVKLLDFGLARLWQALGDTSATRTGDLLGSPLTISPEQAAGLAKRVNRRSDIYSLGATLYWMLAGAPLFIAKEPGRLISMHLNDRPPNLHGRCPDVPPEVSRVVMRCLEKEPSDRPPSAEVVHQAYVRALEGKDPFPPGAMEDGATQPGFINPISRETKRHGAVADPSLNSLHRLVKGPPWWLPVLVFSGILAMLAVAVIVVQGSNRKAPTPAAAAPVPTPTPAPAPDMKLPAPDLSAPSPALPQPPDLTQPPPPPSPAPSPKKIRRPKPARPAPKLPPAKRKVLGEGVLDEF